MACVNVKYHYVSIVKILNYDRIICSEVICSRCSLRFPSMFESTNHMWSLNTCGSHHLCTSIPSIMWQIGPNWSETTLNYQMVVDMCPKPKGVVRSLISGHEIFSRKNYLTKKTSQVGTHLLSSNQKRKTNRA